MQIHFAGWSQPLENYILALEGAGFAVSALREPIPDAGEAWTQMEHWRRIPPVPLAKSSASSGPWKCRFVTVIRNLPYRERTHSSPTL